MANIPKNPIIGQASEFEKHLRKQEELVRENKSKGPARYYANRKPEWATDTNEDDDDGSNIFVQQQDSLSQRPSEGLSMNVGASAQAPRERPRRREKVAATVVSVNESASGINDPRLRRLLKNEKQRIEKEELQNDQSLPDNASNSRGSRRQRIKAQIIQHQKELEVQGSAPVDNNPRVENSSSEVKTEDLEMKSENEKVGSVIHSRRELREAIRMREMVKQESEEIKPLRNNDFVIPNMDNEKEIERNVFIKEEKDDNDEMSEESEEDDDDEMSEEDEWPEMAPPSFVPRGERVLPKIEECLEREEEYFKQSEIERVNIIIIFIYNIF